LRTLRSSPRNAFQKKSEQHYRSDEALTIALMGLIAEESLISQRLARLGRRRMRNARRITAIREDVRLNSGLWELALASAA
jgi:hypothetical protein